jgi:hypothetical protein
MIAYVLAATFSVAVLQAGASPPPVSTAPAAAKLVNRNALFVSPMGEPFRGQPTRAAALEAWFVQTDKDGNRSLSVAEMQGDAARYFAVLDRTKDGEIDPEDINFYESAVVPEIRMMGAGRPTKVRFTRVPDGGSTIDHGSGGGGLQGAQAADRNSGITGRVQKSAPDQGLKGAGWLGLLNIPQPITSADSNFNRGISESEFLKAAGTRFVLLDTDRNGSLSLGELQTRLADLPTGRFGQ